MSEDKVENLHFDVKASSENPTETLVETPGSEILIRDYKEHSKVNNTVNPEEYLLSSVAGCISRIAHIVAFEKDLELEKLRLNVEGSLDPSLFRGKDAENRSGFQELGITIDAETKGSETDLDGWLEEIRKRSQVLDTVENEVPVSLTLQP